MGLFGRVIACVLVILAVLWVTKLEAAASGKIIVPEAPPCISPNYWCWDGAECRILTKAHRR